MAEQNTFKRKFNLILLGSLGLLSVLGAIIIYTITSISKNVENTQRVAETLRSVSASQASIRGFLFNAWSDTVFVKTGTNEEYERFMNYAKAFQDNIGLVKQYAVNEDYLRAEKAEKSVTELITKFNQIGSLIKERGFKNLGHEGKLREAVHKLENSELLKDKAIVLTLRKHEKDFFMRKDVSYLTKFDNEKAKLIQEIESLPEGADKSELKNAATSYFEVFGQVAEIEKQIGLNSRSGIRGEINNLINQSVENLKELKDSFVQKTNNLILTIIGFISFIFLLILVVVYFGLNKLIKPVFEPMQDIQNKASQISEGNLSVNFDEHRNNQVLQDLINGFEKIISKFKTTMEQVENVSNRKITSEMNLHSENDEVGKSLNKIIVQLQKIDEEESRRAWHNEGLAQFASVIRLNNQSEEALYDSIIKELVKYVNANQGALFIIDGEENNDPHLLIKGCYAYDRKKYINKRIEKGEGLTGTCWIEGESIFLTEVPQDYVFITSGTGEARPSCVIIVPIKFNDKVQGAIELASFKVFEPYQIKFIENIAESVGAAVHNMKTNTKTTMLLQKSQEMTEELRAQEEEMRQNMEELQATQEEMRRLSLNLQQEMELLMQENQELKASQK